MHLCDYLVLTPLDEEWRAVCDVLAHAHKEKPIDRITYYLWEHVVPRGGYLMVAASMGRMGLSHASMFAQTAINNWQPQCVVLIGIAGSVVGEVVLGDVIVPYHVVGYEVSKVITQKRTASFRFRPTGHQSDALFLDRVRALRNSAKNYGEWQRTCHRDGRRESDLRDRLETAPTLHVSEADMVASGNTVVSSKQFAANLKAQLNRDIRAVEMEAKGLFHAVYSGGRTNALMIRGISDYADRAKSNLEKTTKDAWRRYAARNAARTLLALLNRQTTPMALPLTVTLDIDRQNSALACTKAGIALWEEGAQNVYIPALFDESNPLPQVKVDIATYKDGQAIIPDHIKCLKQTQFESTEIQGAIGPGRATRFVIPRHMGHQRLALAISSRTSIEKIRVQANDEFGRQVIQEVKVT